MQLTIEVHFDVLCNTKSFKKLAETNWEPEKGKKVKSG